MLDKPFKFFRPTLLRQFLRTGAFTDDNVFPVGNSQFGWIQFIQMEDVHVLKLRRSAAGILDLGLS